MCLEEKEGSVWTLFACSRYGAVVGPCRHSKTLLDSVKSRKYFDELSYWNILKRDSTHGINYFVYKV